MNRKNNRNRLKMIESKIKEGHKTAAKRYIHGGLICTVCDTICIPNVHTKRDGNSELFHTLLSWLGLLKLHNRHTLRSRAIERIIGLTQGKYVCLWRDDVIF